MYIDPSKLTPRGKKVLKGIMAEPYPYDFSPFLSIGGYTLFNNYDDQIKFKEEWEELKVLRELFSGTTMLADGAPEGTPSVGVLAQILAS